MEDMKVDLSTSNSALMLYNCGVLFWNNPQMKKQTIRGSGNNRTLDESNKKGKYIASAATDRGDRCVC